MFLSKVCRVRRFAFETPLELRDGLPRAQVQGPGALRLPAHHGHVVWAARLEGFAA